MFANTDITITAVPLSMTYWHRQVENLLARHDLAIDDDIDYYAAAIATADNTLLAGAGLSRRGVVKCVAVDDALQGTGMAAQLLSHLISEANARGIHQLKVFTRPANTAIFESLGFRLIAQCKQAVMLENGMGGLRLAEEQLASYRKPGRNGLVVVNANPTTLGHVHLLRTASAHVDNLYVMVVAEEVGMFSFRERLEMVHRATAEMPSVTVIPGNDYTISATTFPTYFIKQVDTATDAHIALDLDLCARHIMPALGASVRFVGSEPSDALTARYNTLMQRILPQHSIDVQVIPRYGTPPVSASTVRQLLKQRRLADACRLTPGTSHPYLLAHTAEVALSAELNVTPKPGLVCPDTNGAHSDMDYSTMLRGLRALRQYFVNIFQLGQHAHDNNLGHALTTCGIDAERAMLNATGGVNTHRGAIFAFGLTGAAAAYLLTNGQLNRQMLCTSIATIAKRLPSNGVANHGPLCGPRQMAQDGYQLLFSRWLPLYDRLLQQSPDTAAIQTLTDIIATLDDTNVARRGGASEAARLKAEAARLAADFDAQRYADWCTSVTQRGLSAGGAADMLALTFFCHDLVGETIPNPPHIDNSNKPL